MAKKKDSKNKSQPKLSQSLKTVGGNLSLTEAKKVAKQTGKAPTEVMSQALKKGISLGSKLVAAYNTPGGLGNYLYQGTPDNLKPLKGLAIGKGQVYQGASAYVSPSTRNVNSGYSPGSVTYNPVISQKNAVKGQSGKSKGGGGKGGKVKEPKPLKIKDVSNQYQEKIDTLLNDLSILQGDIETQATDFNTALGERDTYWQEIMNERQMGYDDQMAALSESFNSQLAGIQEAYNMQIQQAALEAERQAALDREAARAFMINQGRGAMPANFQIGPTYGTQQLAGTQGFKRPERRTGMTPGQVATAFTAPTLSTTAASTPMMTQQPSVLNV